jgi:arylsulfatase A-like enzyme
MRNQTDVIVVSDHGFSTISQKVDIAALLVQNGFRACRQYATTGPRQGEVLVVGNGGSVFLYVPEHEPALTEKLVHWLQAQSFTGVILTRKPVEGAFPLESVKLASTNAPDIVLSFRWSADPCKNGTAGLLVTDATQYSSGKGMHASLSRFDLHNTCVAAGPDFRKGFEDHLPSGNIDIAPTILWILGVKPQGTLAGRILTEALAPSDTADPKVEPHHLEAIYRGANLTWKQYLNFFDVNGTVYLDEGNGEQIVGRNLKRN